MDLETVRALGANGLDFLRTKSPRFDAFDALFAPAALEANRMGMLPAQVAELDRKLDDFMRQLVPFFTLPAAHKCLEWLVRRYQIHRFNTASVIRHFLPFHATKVFARIVQLFDIKSDDALWSWLKPFQKGGAAVDRDTLVRRALADHNFLHFICSNVSDPSNELAPDVMHMANMWMSIIVGMLESQCSDDLVQQVLPSIVFAVKSMHANFRAAGYVVLSSIARKQSIEESVRSNLLEIIVKHASAPTLSPAIGCLAVLAVTQPMQNVSVQAVRALFQHADFFVELSSLSDKLNIQPLCLLLITSSLSEAASDSLLNDNVQRLLHDVKFHPHMV